MHEVLHDQLMSLARYVRDPQNNAPPPGIEARRLAVYRQLFFGNVESLLSGGFPVLRASLGAEKWRALVDTFYARYRCQTPLFTEISGEFVDFLAEGGGDAHDLPPWVVELAHYEWVEAALLLSDSPEPGHDPEGDLLEGEPVLSNLAWPLAYQWPVTEISPDYLPQQVPEQPTLVLARRGADQKVHFSRLAPLAHAMLESLQERSCTGRNHLDALAEAIGAETESILPQGLALLENLRAQGVLLGTRA
ncbi:putative DNA-binding domain-containing protein [Pseudomonas sp. JM0905a]|uniref:HvfC family RiPP maturation protein n=1 Tax=Pseudomonas sp. JM0905a TaxID=2772484 RepID=UPI001687374E|nr:putative DNA-binding domain-containing protein [Pseudomonas sp. JM0905a]MBD2839884.1 putative DNA-binding domain-containing protein [Pseudomonas sp. JM0905a]